MRPPTVAFTAGWFTHLGITMAVQDYYGLERWIELCREMWLHISPLWGVSLALISLVIFIGIYGNYRRMEDEQNAETNGG